jgi:hypothetical protein
LNAAETVVSASFPALNAAVVYVSAAATVSRSLSTSVVVVVVVADGGVASVARKVLAVSEELDFSYKSRMRRQHALLQVISEFQQLNQN